MSKYSKIIIISILALILVPTLTLLAILSLQNDPQEREDIIWPKIQDDPESTYLQTPPQIEDYISLDKNNDEIQDYIFKDTVTFEYPKGWNVGTAGQKSGTFEEGVASTYRVNGRKNYASVSIEKLTKSNLRDQTGFFEPKNETIGSKNVITDSGFLSEYISPPTNTNPQQWFEKGLNKMFTIDYYWQNYKMPDYYFVARCSGGGDDKENIIQVCEKVIETFEVKARNE